VTVGTFSASVDKHPAVAVVSSASLQLQLQLSGKTSSRPGSSDVDWTDDVASFLRSCRGSDDVDDIDEDVELTLSGRLHVGRSSTPTSQSTSCQQTHNLGLFSTWM